MEGGMVLFVYSVYVYDTNIVWRNPNFNNAKALKNPLSEQIAF